MKTFITLLLITLCSTSCIINRKLYYESPLSGNTIKYYAMPFLKDSIKTATYGDFNIYSGTANDKGLDNCDYTSYNLHQARKIKNFRFYYGVDFLFGDYITKGMDSVGTIRNNYKNFELGNIKKKFGAYGFQSGIFYTYKKQENFEWRVIGLEYSYKKEFGKYLDFRKSLPDSATSINLADDYIHSLGLSTEIVFSLGTATAGFKAGYGVILNKSYSNPKYYDYYDASPQTRYDYLLLNASINYTKFTFYFQGNFGKFTRGISSGLTYRF